MILNACIQVINARNSVHISEKQIVRMFGVSRQRVRYWRKIGLLPPCVDGGKQGYSFQDVLRVKIISALVSAGIRPAKIRKTLASLRLMLEKNDVLTGKSLYVCGKEIFIFQGGKAITPRTGQYLLFEVDDYQKQLKHEVRNILEQARKVRARDEAASAGHSLGANSNKAGAQ